MTTNVSEPYFLFFKSVKNDNPPPCFVLISRFTNVKNKKRVRSAEKMFILGMSFSLINGIIKLKVVILPSVVCTLFLFPSPFDKF